LRFVPILIGDLACDDGLLAPQPASQVWPDSPR
jgi:hypothetical protein